MQTIQVTASRCRLSATPRPSIGVPLPLREHPFAAHRLSVGAHGDDEHAARVAWLTQRLCSELGVRGALAKRIVRGARCHDVGKAFVPRELLERAGPLNAAEFGEIKLHVTRGAALIKHRALERSVDLSLETSVVLLHHERWDGRGYPHGLAGEEIPLPARIVAVADVYDALVTERAYKTAWSHERAIEAVRDGRGTHFDPACADAMLALSQNLPERWKRNAQRAHERVMVKPPC